jgi:hypothetical protein
MSKKEKDERREILDLIKDRLYDGEWLSFEGVQSIGEKTMVKDVTVADFSGQCLTDIIGSLEDTFGISLEDQKIYSSQTVGDIVSLVRQKIG